MVNEYHKPVLPDAVLHFLRTYPSGIYIDGTLGGGGHAELLMMSISPEGKLVGFDIDVEALNYCRERLRRFGERVTYVHDNFVNLHARLTEIGIHRIQGVLLDLGVSSHQLDDISRGFSFQSDSRIDMRMNQEQSLDGWSVVNTYDETRLANLLWKHGEERQSRRLARKIVDMRKQQSINTTRELSSIVESVVGKRFLQKSLARAFQAIRIEVNNELENLHRALASSVELLEEGGRVVVITYHSLEDRIVKEFFKRESRMSIPSGNKLVPDRPAQPRLTILTKKPITPGPAEVADNPRARSAKLRAAERS